MAKKLTGSLILACVLTLPSVVAYSYASSSVAQTAAEAAKAKPDTPVALTGHLVKSLGEEKYLFKDHSGEVEVEIDNALWRDIEVLTNTTVILKGEVDDEWQGVEIEIDAIDLLAD